MYEINETHDPNLKSWVESANDPETDFPIQNLPFCRFYSKEPSGAERDGKDNWYYNFGFVIGNNVLPIRFLENEAVFNLINPTIDQPFVSYESFRSSLYWLGWLAFDVGLEAREIRSIR